MNFQQIRNSCRTFFTLSNYNTTKVENAALALWIFAVVASTLTHELWRDETREYLMAIGTNNFADYFNFAKYDGHPLLWRTILMAFYYLIPHPVILQMASLTIGFATVYLIVKHSPFPLVFKVLFIFGIIPFSTNTVDARDYGISMLLFFALAILYSKSERHPITMGILLFLEANTNSYGMYLSGLFLGLWFAEAGFAVLTDKRYLLAAAIALAGIFISYYSTRIDMESVFVDPGHFARIDYWHATLKAIRHPGEFIAYIFALPKSIPPYPQLIIRDLFVVSLFVGLFVIRPYLGATLWAAVTFFNFVGITIIYPQTRHQGVLLGFIIALFWIALHGIFTGRYPGLFRHAKNVFSIVLFASLVPFLVLQVQINTTIVLEEARLEKSSALAVGKYLKTNSQLRDAIIIGSPEYMLEPISFYSGNRLYLAQEQTFHNFIKFSREFEKPTSIEWLLKNAEELHAKHKVPILIILGHFGIVEDKTFLTIYRGTFVTKHLYKLKENTLKLAEFNKSLGDENFQVFLYLPKEELLRYKEKYMEVR